MTNATRRIGLALAVLGLVVGAAGRARAGLLINTDSHSTTGSSTNFMSPGSGIGTTFAVGQDITLTNIASFADPIGTGAIKFVILDHATHALLYESGSKAFSGGNTWYTSDSFSFTLLAGKSYDIGALANIDAGWRSDQATESANGLTSTAEVRMGNYSGISPTISTHFVGRSSAIQLFGEVAAVPEPSTLVSAGIAAVLALGYGYRTRRAKVAA